ncbi:hypothetical protein GJAV_G00122910 [Gymnothorax javanicus]|nr:hypothetical protein GJAV_G00122910 [Gymnothorax javanicus]
MAMPEFHRLMRGRLRTVEQGADTVVWLAVSEAAAATPSGQFFQDRQSVPAHLPLAWTHSSLEEEQNFMTELDQLATAFKPLTETPCGLVRRLSQQFSKPTV